MICCSTSIVWGMYRYGAGDSLVKLENYVGCPWNLCGASVKCSVESFSHKTFIGGWLWAPQLRVAVTSDHCRSSKHRHSCLTHKTAESLQTIFERVKNACSNSCYARFHKSPKKYSAWNSYIFHTHRTDNLYRTLAGNRHFLRYMHLYTVS